MGAFVAACLLAAAWGSLVQTQFNLNAIAAAGAPMPMGVRLQVSLQDLLGFAPLYAGIVLVAWLPAFAVAAWLVHTQAAFKSPARRAGLYALAAGLSVMLAIRAADAVAPMPVLIDATRGTAGLLAMAAGCALGGWLFARWVR